MCIFFFFNDTATTEIYTLSLHDALPIFYGVTPGVGRGGAGVAYGEDGDPDAIRRRVPVPVDALAQMGPPCRDRKSTRLNSSHANISYAVFCLKKKKNR